MNNSINADVKKIKRIEQIGREALAYAKDYCANFNTDRVPLRLLSSRYGRAFKSVGLSVREGLEATTKLAMVMNPRGTYEVLVLDVEEPVKANAKGLSPLAREILSLIQVDGSSFKDLELALAGRGIKLSALMDELIGLDLKGEIVLKDMKYFLPPE